VNDRVYGHSCGGRCGDRRTASHEYEMRTLVTFHFMAISVAWDVRPEKKLKFSALFAQKIAHKHPNFADVEPSCGRPVISGPTRNGPQVVDTYRQIVSDGGLCW